jgi:hypothetical protein
MTLECIDPNLLPVAVRFDEPSYDAVSGLRKARSTGRRSRGP